METETTPTATEVDARRHRGFSPSTWASCGRVAQVTGPGADVRSKTRVNNASTVRPSSSSVSLHARSFFGIRPLRKVAFGPARGLVGLGATEYLLFPMAGLGGVAVVLYSMAGVQQFLSPIAKAATLVLVLHDLFFFFHRSMLKIGTHQRRSYFSF